MLRRQLSWLHCKRAAGELGFGDVGGRVEPVVGSINRDRVGVGITAGAEVDVVGLVEAEDVMNVVEILSDVVVITGVLLEVLLGAVEDELLITLEAELKDPFTVLDGEKELVELTGSAVLLAVLVVVPDEGVPLDEADVKPGELERLTSVLVLVMMAEPLLTGTTMVAEVVIEAIGKLVIVVEEGAELEELLMTGSVLFLHCML